METPFHVTYAGTDIVDADSDGDGVRDGADDQDHDDIPNVDGAQPDRGLRPGRHRGRAGCKVKESLLRGNFIVSGGPLPDSAVVVTFVNELGNSNIAQMTASGAGLTGGTSPNATVTTIQERRRWRRRAADG